MILSVLVTVHNVIGLCVWLLSPQLNELGHRSVRQVFTFNFFSLRNVYIEISSALFHKCFINGSRSSYARMAYLAITIHWHVLSVSPDDFKRVLSHLLAALTTDSPGSPVYRALMGQDCWRFVLCVHHW